jgi:hypothetical protein
MFSTGFGSSMGTHPNFKGDYLKMLVVLKVGHIFSGKGFQLAFPQFKHSLPAHQKDHSKLLVLRVCNIFSGNVFYWFLQFNDYLHKLQNNNLTVLSNERLSHLSLEMFQLFLKL